MNGSDWLESGDARYFNLAGVYKGDRYCAGFRFILNDLEARQSVAHARLRFARKGGKISTQARLFLRGLLQESPSSFTADSRPSQKGPKTQSQVPFTIFQEWTPGSEEVPRFTWSPDITAILNEILGLPGWGTGDEGKALALTLESGRDLGEGDNFVAFDDLFPGFLKSPVMLEIYPTLYDTFLGAELVGRVTDRSAEINLHSLVMTDTYIEFGDQPGVYTARTPELLDHPAESPILHLLTGLKPDRRCFYRLRYRLPGEKNYHAAKERSFRTQRARGERFTFAIQADEHLQSMVRLPENRDRMALYKRTLKETGAASPDFLISMGDFAQTEFNRGRAAADLGEARYRYLAQRAYLGAIVHSVPFYLVLGNHEGEQGWHYDPEDAGCLAAISGKARNEILLNPYPGDFYSGNPEKTPHYGLRGNYYAWEWGDALFVVLDPFYRTVRQPNTTRNGWDWTLGEEQYEWLHQTLQRSRAAWKLVFIHHLTSTIVNPHKLSHYGRGGIEAAKFRVDGRPSFEWGGEDEQGVDRFAQMRPGWSHGPVHDLLAAGGVDILFHGHDHCYARQDLDGIVYQECPQPADASYGWGARFDGHYKEGVILKNSGFLKVTVSSDRLSVEYILSFLPGEGEQGKVGHFYELEK